MPSLSGVDEFDIRGGISLYDMALTAGYGAPIVKGLMLG